MKYDSRIILFVDILGFTNEVKKSENNPQIIEKLKDCLEHIQGLFYNNINNDDVEFTQFSDSILISIPKNYPGGVYYTIIDASFIIHSLFSNGFICKGNITIGEIYHKENLLFGPGFLEAMKLEAIEDQPIIKFHEKFIELARENPGEGNIGYPDGEISYIKKHIKKIENSNYYELCWRENYADLIGSGNEDTENHYKLVRQLIENNIKNFRKIRVLKKYLFLAHKFNDSNYYDFKVDMRYSKKRYLKKYLGHLKDEIKSYFEKYYWKKK